MSDPKARKQKTESFIDHIRSQIINDISQTEQDYYEILPRYEKMIDRAWKLWRFEKGHSRYYFNPDQDVLYPSTTSIIWNEMKTSPFLKKWQYEMVLKHGSTEAPSKYMNERSHYGTLMHILYTESLFADILPIDSIDEIVRMYRDLNELYGIDTRSWVPELKSDLSAFYEWIRWVNLEIIAVEIPIYYPIIHKGETIGWIAGTIDLIAEIDVRKDGGDVTEKTPMNNRERARVIVDYKSGKKGFYDSHEIQVNSYMHGWNWVQKEFLNDSYPVSRCYNFAPKDSRGAKATFTFKNQTGADSYKKFPYLYAMYKIDGYDKVNPFRVIEGDFERGKGGSKNIRLVDPIDYIKESFNSNEE